MNNTTEKKIPKMAIVVVLLSWLFTCVLLYWIPQKPSLQSLPSGDIKKAIETGQQYDEEGNEL